MQSSGGLLTLDQAQYRAVNLLLSGPAGGLSAVRLLGKSLQQTRILSFDMGGTSTDVSLMDGDFTLTDEGQIAGWPTAVPMLNMDTIGAGGGSIAWIDEAGMLHVGPESAGSTPGPVCYDQGGTQPTVTDANLVLGHLPKTAKLGGSLRLNHAAAYEAVQSLGSKLGLSPSQTAQGIIELAEQQMVAALHNISVKQGHSPKDFILCCFGGAGGMHVCSLADQLDMSQALIPSNAGVLSAFGMLTAPPMHNVTRSVIKPFSELEQGELETRFEAMLSELSALNPELAAQGIIKRRLDLRYLGQSYTIEVEYDTNSGSALSQDQFEHLHEQRYGHRLDKDIELVNLKMSLAGEPNIQRMSEQRPHLEVNATGKDKSVNSARDTNEPVIYPLEDLQQTEQYAGPAIIMEATSTIWVPLGWAAQVDAYGNIQLNRKATN